MRVVAGVAGAVASFLVIGLAAAPAAVAGMPAAGTAAGTTPPPTLYVGGSATCSDQGSGTQAVPFCTLQKAADVVSPGQTVMIQEGGRTDYGSVTFTRSGTPSAPISFVTVGGYLTFRPGSSEKAGIIFQGVRDVHVSGLAVDPSGSTDGIDISGSASVALEHVVVGQLGMSYSGTGVAIDGASSDVTISRSGVYGADNPGVTVQAGARNVTVTTNVIATHAIAVGINGVTSANVTSNTIAACQVGIGVTGGTSAVVENNALLFRGTDSSSCPVPGTALSVAGDSTATVRADYNAWGWPAGPGSAYSWAGTAYTSVPAFQAATGQGAHDLTPVAQNISDGMMAGDSPLIDSADCAAPGELSADITGQPRVDDPLVADTGNGACHADRGAFDLQDPLGFNDAITPGSMKVAALQDVTVSIAAAAATSPWGEPVTYTADFGDGYTAAITPGGSASHAYAAPGQFTITMLAADTGGSSFSRQQQVTVYPAVAPVVTLTAKPVVLASLGIRPTIGADEVAFTGSAGADNGELASATIDFGDGASTQITSAVPAALASVPHVYAKAGTYTATLTTTDEVGRQSTASVEVTVGDETDFTFNTPFVAYSHTVAAHAVVKLSPRQLGLAFTAGDPAAFVTVTVTSPAKAGYVTVYPAGTSRPQTAAVQFLAGHAASNVALATAGSGQSVDFYNGSAGPISLTIHTIGFEEGQATGESTYAPDTPATVLGTTRIAGKHHVAFPVAGLDGVPKGPDATGLDVVLDITESGGAAAGYFTAGPEKTTYVRMPEPGAYWARGQQVTGLAVVPVDGRVVLSNASSGAADFTASVVGYYDYSTTGAVFLPSAPRRLLTIQVGGKHWVRLGVAGRNGVPATTSAGATTAVALNLTATAAAANGTVTAYADGTARPAVTTLSYSAAAPTASAAIVAVGRDGAIDLYNSGLRPVTLMIDLTGSYWAYS